MELVIATTRSNDPEVHAPGCADIKRGRTSGKYDRAMKINVDTVEDAARWFWEDFLPGGCAYEEQGPGTGMTDEQAQGYTTYLPCTDKFRKVAETSQEPFTSATAEGNVLPIGENNTREASAMTTETTTPTLSTEDAKHVKSLQAPSRHERLAKHLLQAHSATPADLDDHEALVALHAEIHAADATAPEANADIVREPVQQEVEPGDAAQPDAYPTEDGHAKVVETETATPKVSKRDAKQALARHVVEAIDAAMKNLPAEVLAAFSQDQAARCTAQWIHHLPTGGVWPAEVLPKPDRSDWNGRSN